MNDEREYYDFELKTRSIMTKSSIQTHHKIGKKNIVLGILNTGRSISILNSNLIRVSFIVDAFINKRIILIEIHSLPKKGAAWKIKINIRNGYYESRKREKQPTRIISFGLIVSPEIAWTNFVHMRFNSIVCVCVSGNVCVGLHK